MATPARDVQEAVAAKQPQRVNKCAPDLPKTLTGVFSDNIEIFMSGLEAQGSSISGNIEIPASMAADLGLEAKEKSNVLNLSKLRGVVIDQLTDDKLIEIMKHLHTIRYIYRFGRHQHEVTLDDTAAVVLLLFHSLLYKDDRRYGRLSALSVEEDKIKAQLLLQQVHQAIGTPQHTERMGTSDMQEFLTTTVKLITTERNPFLSTETLIVENTVKRVAEHLKLSLGQDLSLEKNLDISGPIHSLASKSLSGNAPSDGTVYGILLAGILACADDMKLREQKEHLKHHWLIQSGLAGIGFAPPIIAGLAGLAMASEQYWSDRRMLTHKNGHEAVTMKFMASIKYGVLKYGRPDFASLGPGVRTDPYSADEGVSFILWLQTALEACGRV